MSRLQESLATPDGKRAYNRRLFATIAEKYDVITRVLSGGRDQAWKRRVLMLADIRVGDRVLDLASGTGDLAYLSVNSGADVVGLDLAPEMLGLAKVRGASVRSARVRGARVPEARVLHWCVGDMCALPLADAQFTAVTTGYGLRNVPDISTAISEVHRVLKPGGRFCSLDFDRPDPPWLRAVYLAYLTVVGGALGWLLHRDPDTYRYIPVTIARYPGARVVADMLRHAGFSRVRHIKVLGGLMAIHVAEKDGTAPQS